MNSERFYMFKGVSSALDEAVILDGYSNIYVDRYGIIGERQMKTFLSEGTIKQITREAFDAEITSRSNDILDDFKKRIDSEYYIDPKGKIIKYKHHPLNCYAIASLHEVVARDILGRAVPLRLRNKDTLIKLGYLVMGTREPKRDNSDLSQAQINTLWDITMSKA